MQGRQSRISFEQSAKNQQRFFRDSSVTISDDGRSPTDDKGRRNPHLLGKGSEIDNLFSDIRGEDGAIGFFRERNIKWWKSSRSGDDSHPYTPTRNMASSQVACVNFLLPLANIPGALLSVLQGIDDDVVDLIDIPHQGDKSPVEFEWIGPDLSLEGGRVRGANNTSVDAFLIAQTRSGRRRAYLLEWKYTERYLSSDPKSRGDGPQGETRKRRYTDRYHASFSSFDTTVVPELDDFLYEPFYQIMRQRLLADRMVQDCELGIEEAKVVVVVPEENWAYRTVSDGSTTTSPPLAKRFLHLKTVEAVMRASLKDSNAQFDMVAPRALMDGVVRDLPAETSEWSDYWEARYGV